MDARKEDKHKDQEILESDVSAIEILTKGSGMFTQHVLFYNLQILCYC